MIVFLQLSLLPVVAYLLGSIPFGLVLTRLFSSVDIRSVGSGNIGATNVRRAAGTPLGVLTLAGDLLKGAVPAYLGLQLVDAGTTAGALYLSAVVLAAFSGHLFPLFLGFKDGGKGVATAAGAFLAISPASVLVALLVFVLCVCWFHRVSVASLAASATLPVALWESIGSGALTGCAAVVAVAIVLRHTDNIRRLLAGTEPRI